MKAISPENIQQPNVGLAAISNAQRPLQKILVASAPLSRGRNFSLVSWRAVRPKAAVNAPHSKRFAKTEHALRSWLAAPWEHHPTWLVSSAKIIIACAFTFAGCWNDFGLGADYPNDQPVMQPSWPAGMSQLANKTNRIGGLFVNAEDVFFFSGTMSDFNAFLADYSSVKAIEKHRLILHEGKGEAFSLGGVNKRPCDWKLDGCPAAWRDMHQGNFKTPRDTNYVLEVQFWTGGKIPLNQLVIPKNVELAGDCFKKFESITSGMTRSEVEQRLTMDGGLQSVSPVRFLDPGCPGFKISVEFDFKRDADGQNRAIQGKDDKVIQVSHPFLERPFTD